MERVGLVGCGSIGLALLERLVLAGVHPTVYDVDGAACELARQAGGKVMGSPAEVARESTLIDVVVRTDEDVLACTKGPDGILAGAAPDTLVLLHSTIHPRTTREVASASRERSIQVIDACMLGMPHEARAGREIFMVGGPKELFERARPHLLSIGAEAVHFGPLTSGNTAKIVKNSLTGVQWLMIAEAERFARAGGLSDGTFRELLRLFHRTPPMPPGDPSDNPRGTQNLYGKDLPLAAELGDELGLQLPVTTYASEVGKRLLD